MNLFVKNNSIWAACPCAAVRPIFIVEDRNDAADVLRPERGGLGTEKTLPLVTLRQFPDGCVLTKEQLWLRYSFTYLDAAEQEIGGYMLENLGFI